MPQNLSSSIANLPNLGPGSTDSASVRALQQALVNAGYMTQAQMNTGPGIYGNQTKAAVAAWQSANSINAQGNPGYFGPISKAFITSGGSSTTTSGNLPLNKSTTNLSTDSPSKSSGSPQPLAWAPTVTPSIIGQYKGINITGGTQAEVSAQIAKIDATPSSTSSSSTSSGIDGTTPKATAPKTVPWASDYTLPPGFTLSKTDQGGTAYLDANGNLYIRGSGGFELRNDLKPAVIPEGVGIPPSLGGTSLGNLPPDSPVFKVVIPQLKPGTPEYQAAMDQISNAYFDVMQQQMNSSTAQQLEAANYNWQTLKRYIESNLNVKLADDAYQAWDQIQGLNSQFGQQNIQGSGLENESIDSYLSKVRRMNSVTRSEAQTKQESAQQDYYMKFATSEQIKQLIATNPAKAQAWGLVPTPDVLAMMNRENLKSKYPELSDEDIQSYISSILDENGNYRSNLYQKYMTGANIGANVANITTTLDQYGQPISKLVTPSDFGVLDINAARAQNKASQIEMQNLAIDKANRDKLGSTPSTGVTSATSGTAAGTLFNQPPKVAEGVATGTPTTTGTFDDPLGLKAAAAAASNLGTNTTTTSTAPVVSTPTAITAEQYKLTPTELASPTGIAEYNARIAKLRNPT